MAAPLKWFPFYIDAWETDEAVRLMTFEERGIYLSLLCWQWREGTIPQDAKKIATVLRARIANVRTVLKRGFRDDGMHLGRLINHRLAELRVNQLTRAGKASTSSRGWKTTEERYLYAAEMEILTHAAESGPRRIKIGWSRNPKSRVSALARELQQRPRLIGMRTASISLERKAHVDLAAYRVQGEWFDDVPPVRQWLLANGVTGGVDGAPGGELTIGLSGETAVRSRMRSEIQKSLSAAAEGRKSKAAP